MCQSLSFAITCFWLVVKDDFRLILPAREIQIYLRKELPTIKRIVSTTRRICHMYSSRKGVLNKNMSMKNAAIEPSTRVRFNSNILYYRIVIVTNHIIVNSAAKVTFIGFFLRLRQTDHSPQQLLDLFLLLDLVIHLQNRLRDIFVIQSTRINGAHSMPLPQISRLHLAHFFRIHVYLVAHYYNGNLLACVKLYLPHP